MDERDALVLNDVHQVVGPTRRIVRTFTRFCGTIAGNPKLAPLNILNWHDMPMKDQIWELLQVNQYPIFVSSFVMN